MQSLKRKKLSAKRTVPSKKPREQPSHEEFQEEITIKLPPSSRTHAISSISRGLYRRGLRKLFQCSPAAKKALPHVLDLIVRKEVRSALSAFKRSSTSILKCLTEFSWEKLFTKLQTSAPILATVIRSSVTTTRNRDSVTRTMKKKVVSLKPIIGTIMSIICFTKNARCNLLQTFVSLFLWMAGCKPKVFRGLSTIGLCQSIDSTKNTVESLRKDYDSRLLGWRDKLRNKHKYARNAPAKSMVVDGGSVDDQADIEEGWEDLDMEVSEAPEDTEQSVNDNNRSSELDECEETLETLSDSSIQIINSLPGTPIEDIPNAATDSDSNVSEDFSVLPSETRPFPKTKRYYDITFDNLKQAVGVCSHHRANKSTMLNLVQAFATLERVSTNGLSNEIPSPQMIRSIPISKFLPSSEDELLFEAELEMIVSRILTSYIPAFQSLEVLESLPHDYSREAKQKSLIVPLGVMKKDVTKPSEMVEVLEEYSKYVVGDKQGKALPLLLFCDGLSCEQVAGAQKTRWNGEDDMFEPVVQEGHRRVVFVQDTFDELFKLNNQKEKGTFSYLKQYFHYTAVTSNVKDCFSKADEFLDFVTSGYIVLCAMHKCNMTNLGEIPDNFPQDDEEQQAFRDSLACQIVKDITMKPNTSEVVNMSIDKNLAKSHFCVCKLDVDGPMICCQNADCERGAWFHLQCLGMEEDRIPRSDWYCSNECRVRKGQKESTRTGQDLQNEYVRYLMWRGLNNMARHDAIKENDGPRMIRHWKYDMFELNDKNHPEYFIHAHRLLANMAGATSERIRHNILWERTVNTTGRKRENIAKDLQCDYFNNQFKQHCKNAAALNDEIIHRLGQMVEINSMLSKAFDEQVVGTCQPRGKCGQVDFSNDIRRMVHHLQPLELFSFKQGRLFNGFEDLKPSHGTQFPVAMKQKIATHLENLAEMREIMMDG